MGKIKVVKTEGFTVMSNYHLKDKSISLKAKGLLSQMLSLPENWDYTIKGLAAINKEGIDAIRTTLNELEEFCYIKRERVRNSQGQVKGTNYTVFEMPQIGEFKPKLENPTQANFTQKEPILEKPIQAFPTQDEPTQAKPTQDKPILENPTESNTNLIKYLFNKESIYQSKEYSSDEMDRIDKYVAVVKKNIEYDYLILPEKKNDVQIIDELVNLMVDTIVFNNEPVKIKGSTYPAEVIKTQFLKLNAFHIEYVLDCLRKNTTKVRNIKSYLIATLYNAPVTISNHYRAETNHDMYGGGN